MAHVQSIAARAPGSALQAAQLLLARVRLAHTLAYARQPRTNTPSP